MNLRKGLYSDSPGAYTQILNSNKTSISPGEVVEISHLITGYGKIDAAKIYFSCSSNTVLSNNPSETYVEEGLGQMNFNKINDEEKRKICDDLNIEINELTEELYIEKKLGTYHWGANKRGILEYGIALCLTSGFINEEGNSSMFIDYEGGEKQRNPMILTEMTMSNKPPFKWHLKTLKNAKPGNYKLSFSFSYFNGDKYIMDIQVLDIKILYWYEKHEKTLKRLAYITVFLSITSTTLNIIDKVRGYLKNEKSLTKNELYMIQKSNEIENKIDTLTKRINVLNDSI